MPIKSPAASLRHRVQRRSLESFDSSGIGRLTRFGSLAVDPTRRVKASSQPHAHVVLHALNLKRAYERRAPGDGTRVLVDRLWPRGMSKERLALDFWLKDLAPSDALRRWYGHNPGRWPLFADRYRSELAQQGNFLHLLEELRRRGPLTLLYAARDTARNHAVVLRAVLEERRTGGNHPQ
jgi:uncharacterized protein YeaO (DUF488 family)